MPKQFIIYNLKPNVTDEEYKEYCEKKKGPFIFWLPSCKSFKLLKIVGSRKGPIPYKYIGILDPTSVEEWQKDVASEAYLEFLKEWVTKVEDDFHILMGQEIFDKETRGIILHAAIVADNKAVLDKFVPAFCGDRVNYACLSMTDSSGGADSENPLLQGRYITTKARLKGGEWVINGTKSWPTHAGIASVYLTICTTDPNLGDAGIALISVPSKCFPRL